MSRQPITPEDGKLYEFTPTLEPAVTVDSGESLTVETLDSLEGAIRSDSDRLESIPDEVNAATGPIAVTGFGTLDGHDDIEAPRSRMTPVDGDAGTITFGDIDVAIDPCIGTIGVATRDDEPGYSTLVPHDHGGNLDTTDITAGNTVYFPVFQPGGLLAMGDCKAAMADGEMCGTGSEIATEIDLTVEVIEQPDFTLERPLVETADAWKPLASAETLEEACELANRDAIALLRNEHDLSGTEAYMLSSLVGGLEISQVVDPLVTVRNAVPKAHCGGPFQ